MSLTSGSRHDVTQLLALLDSVPPVREGRQGQARRRADRVQGDRAYHGKKYLKAVRARGMEPLLAQRGTGHGSGLGKTRWVAEDGFAKLHKFKRLIIRYDRLATMHEGFLRLAIVLMCYAVLNR